MRRNEMYRGKPRGLYDPSTAEMFFAELGREIYKETEDKIHKKQMSSEEWNLYCNTANKCVRVGTVWGPKRIDDFSQDEQRVMRLFLDRRPEAERTPQ